MNPRPATPSWSGWFPIRVFSPSERCPIRPADTFTAGTLQKGTWYGQFFYAKNVKGDPFNVVTIRPAIIGRVTFVYVGMTVLEYSGVDKNAPLSLDIAGPQGQLSGAWNSTPFNVGAGDLVVLGIVTANGGAYTPGAGFKIEDQYLTPAANKFSFAVNGPDFLSRADGRHRRRHLDRPAASYWRRTLSESGPLTFGGYA